MPPGELNNNLNRLPEEYGEIRLTGSMRDAKGNAHEVDEVFADLPEWRELLSRERFVGLPERELAEAFKKSFERASRIWIAIFKLWRRPSRGSARRPLYVTSTTRRADNLRPNPSRRWIGRRDVALRRVSSRGGSA